MIVQNNKLFYKGKIIYDPKKTMEMVSVLKSNAKNKVILGFISKKIKIK